MQSGGAISDRLPVYKRVVVTECMSTEERRLRLSVQHVDDGMYSIVVVYSFIYYLLYV
jgi:hypothetical protein